MRRHASVGVTVSVGFLFLTVAGLIWSWMIGVGIVKLRETMDWYMPKSTITTTTPASYDWSKANSAMNLAHIKELSGKVELTPPEAGTVWMVKKAREEWRMDIGTVTVDGSTGAVVDRIHFADWPLPAKLTEQPINVHMGILSGQVDQLALALIGVASLAMIVRGYAIQFEHGRDDHPGRFPTPTCWWDIRLDVAAAIVALLIAYSVVAPLFGVTLAGFVIIDWAQRKLRRGQCRFCRPRVPCVSGNVPGAGKRRVRLTRFPNFEENTDVQKPNPTILTGFS